MCRDARVWGGGEGGWQRLLHIHTAVVVEVELDGTCAGMQGCKGVGGGRERGPRLLHVHTAVVVEVEPTSPEEDSVQVRLQELQGSGRSQYAPWHAGVLHASTPLARGRS